MTDRPLVVDPIEPSERGIRRIESRKSEKADLDGVSSGARTAKRNMKLSRTLGSRALAVPPRSFFSG